MNDDKPRFGAAGEDPLDRAIDRAVRAMMHVDPPAGLRRRVLSRIEAPSRRPALFTRIAFATAALAILVLAVVVIRRGGSEPGAVPPPTIATGPQAPATSAPPLATAKGPVSPEAASPPGGGRRPPRRDDGLIDMPRVRNVFGPPAGRIVGASVTDPSTSPAGVGPGVASETSGEDSREIPGIAPLRIAPLEVKPLQIVPLGPPK